MFVFLFLLCAAPALAVSGPSLLPQLQPQEEQEQPSALQDSIMWMAAPKKRRTIEVNRTRRRADSKLLKVKVHRIRLELDLLKEAPPTNNSICLEYKQKEPYRV